jgi:hypothetical protein
MRLNLIAGLALALLFAATGSAEARRHQRFAADGSEWQGHSTSRSYRAERRHHRHHRRVRSQDWGGSSYDTASRHSVGGRPSRWCGWWMRTQLGGGPEFNLAANWRRYGSAASPQVGAVVVWPHHVGMITGRAPNGQWIVKSGNDGGRVRERARSVAGAVFRI